MKKLLVLLVIAFAGASCNVRTDVSVTTTPSIRDVKGFDQIEVSGAIDLSIVQGTEESVSVSASSDELAARVKTEVTGGVLKIYVEDKGFWHSSINGKVQAFVTFKELERLESSGACTVKAKRINTKDLKIELSGASYFEGNVSVENLDLDISGASNIKISGAASATKIDASGACNLKGYNLKTDFCKVDASGASSIHIWVSKEISGEASGGSSITYKGDGVEKDISTSGAGSIKKSSGDD